MIDALFLGTQNASCTEGCPVDPWPGEPDLFVAPDKCIDCDACLEARPALTAKERLSRLVVDELSELEAERTLAFIARRLER